MDTEEKIKVIDVLSRLLNIHYGASNNQLLTGDQLVSIRNKILLITNSI